MRLILLAAVSALAPIAATAEDAVRIVDPWARASILPSRPGAAYLTLESAEGDRLVGVASPVADDVVVHVVDETDGVSRMRPLTTLDLPPGEAVAMSVGGMHLMLMGLEQKLIEGTRFPLTLQFENAGERTVEVPVLGVAATGPQEAER